MKEGLIIYTKKKLSKIKFVQKLKLKTLFKNNPYIQTLFTNKRIYVRAL